MRGLRFGECISFSGLCLSEDCDNADGVENQKHDVGDITCKQNRALPTFEFAHNQCGYRGKARNRKTEREVDGERLCVYGKGVARLAHRDKRANGKNEGQVDDICADNVADGQVCFLFDNGSDCRDEFGQRRAYCKNRDADDAFGNVERTSKLCAVVAHKLRANEYCCRTENEENNVFADILFLDDHTGLFEHDFSAFEFLEVRIEYSFAFGLIFFDSFKAFVVDERIRVLLCADDVFDEEKHEHCENDYCVPPIESAVGTESPQECDSRNEYRDLKNVVFTLEERSGEHERNCHNERNVAVDGAYCVAYCHGSLSLRRRYARNQDFGDCGCHADDGCADDKRRNARHFGDPTCRVHEPVAAFDDKQNSECEQDDVSRHAVCFHHRKGCNDHNSAPLRAFCAPLYDNIFI